MIVFTGCHSIVDKGLGAAGLTEISKVNSQIDTLKQNQATLLKQLNDKQIADNEVIAAVNLSRERAASDELFKAAIAYTLKPVLDDYDLIAQNSVESAMATLPAPDAKTITDTLSLVKKELIDKTNLAKTLADQLQAAKDNAKILSDSDNKAKEDLTSITKQKADIITTTNTQIDSLQKAKDSALSTILEKQQEILNNKAEWDKIKKYITFICGGLSLLFLAASIYGPILKGQSLVFAGILASIAIGIQFLTGYIVGVIALVGLAILLLYIHYQHHTATTALNIANSTIAKAATPIIPIITPSVQQ